ncbi:MAG: hypothetical protein FJ170_09070, partial [Gammaproteobacteria bacterium]|nr:hypothetical protein [Gammaproteobacteria bacterium]
MDRQLAERMVGAACLLAVLVLVVPAVLDGNRPTEGTGAEPVLPEVGGLRRHTLSLDGAERVPPVPVLPDRPGEAAGTLPDDELPAGVMAPPVELPEAMPPAPVAGPEAGQTTVAPPAKADDADSDAEPPVVPAPVPAPSSETSAPPAAGQWYVQLGSFSSRQNAEGLEKKLAAAGFDATIRKSDKGSLLRVLAGPRADRDAAVILQGKLKAAGYTGQV